MSEPIKVAIRADAGPLVGTGHFARTAAVADILSTGGDTEMVLLTNAEGAALADRYFPADTRVVSLAQNECRPEEAMRALNKYEWVPDVVILDQYGSVQEWETLAASTGTRLMVFDDFDIATRADIIVRPHRGRVSGRETNVLRGPAYLPLSRHITKLAQSPSQNRSSRLRLNICFGGSDPTGETEKALEAIADLEALDVDVVIGPGAKIAPLLIEAAEQMPHVTLYRAPNQKQLAELIFAADLALGAGGVMLWERLCLGVPSLVISIAQNQQAQIDAMINAGAIRFLGEHDRVTPATIACAVNALATDKAGCKAIAEAGRNLVDGRGASRLVSWIRALALAIREVKTDDASDLLNWRTDDRNWQHNFANSEKPDFDAHMGWFSKKLADPNCVFRIAMRGTNPVGVVRFDINSDDNSAYLSIYLVPEWHGRKMGLPVYLAAERELRRCRPNVDKIISRIHSANTASERLHRDAGFEVSVSRDRADWLDAWKLLD
ncbi:GNAT family N-acetyltransferase [Parasphingorhabdus sp.]|uniref:GNAT family N-acetyltransferase n=1 Tax=Parasphingorhabdus sp. TaxID=2709688 RepID=UPI003BB0D005